MDYGKIEKWAEDSLAMKGFAENGEEHHLWVLLRHLFSAVAMYDKLSADDRKIVNNYQKKFRNVFESKFSLKERKRNRKDKEKFSPVPPIKEKESPKEKSEKISLSTGLDFSKLDDEQKAFWNECSMYINNPYDEQMVLDFFRCYGEKSQKTGKMFWQTKRTWNTAFRLVAWSKRSFGKNDEAAAIRLKKAQQHDTKQVEVKQTQAVAAAQREAENARREAEIKQTKAEAVSYEEYQKLKAEGKI